MLPLGYRNNKEQISDSTTGAVSVYLAERTAHMKAVITGATGAIGMALISELVKRDIEVLALCRPNSGRNSRLESFGPMGKTAACDISELHAFTPAEV